MNFGPVNKLDKKNTATLKKFIDDVMSANCDVIIFSTVLPLFSQVKLHVSHAVEVYINYQLI